ncbi:MAG: LPS export ABC transporter periplasmic protein LptC [Pseudomonadota bacterium]
MAAVSYTSVVRVARIVLPVAALGLLSTLFLLARQVDPNAAIHFTDVDVSERARALQLTEPRIAGVSRDGTAYRLSVADARPDASDARRMTADSMRLELNDEGEGGAIVSAAHGVVDTGRRAVVLDGEVWIETTTGYSLRTQRLEGELAEMYIVAPGEVVGTGPMGRMRAGAMRIEGDENGQQRLAFTGGVELLYLPPSD